MGLDEDIEEKIKYFDLILIFEAKLGDLHALIGIGCFFVEKSYYY